MKRFLLALALIGSVSNSGAHVLHWLAIPLGAAGVVSTAVSSSDWVYAQKGSGLEYNAGTSVIKGLTLFFAAATLSAIGTLLDSCKSKQQAQALVTETQQTDTTYTGSDNKVVVVTTTTQSSTLAN